MKNYMETVCQVCKIVRDNSIQKLSFHSLMCRIRREFQNNYIDLYIRSSRKTNLTADEYYVNAYYDAENEIDNEVPIEIVIYHNFDRSVLWEKRQVNDLLIQVYDAVVHEFRHQHQSRKRGHKIFWSHSNIVLQYLSDPDEIDAYALSIAIELCRSLGKQRSLKHLSKYKLLSKFRVQGNLTSSNLFAFVNAFDSVDQKILDRLIKKVYKILQKIDTDNIFM